jgi:hypothetical protein
MESEPESQAIFEYLNTPEQQALAEDQRDHSDVHGVAYVAI